jgi:hypothetical protein
MLVTRKVRLTLVSLGLYQIGIRLSRRRIGSARRGLRADRFGTDQSARRFGAISEAVIAVAGAAWTHKIARAVSCARQDALGRCESGLFNHAHRSTGKADGSTSQQQKPTHVLLLSRLLELQYNF